MLLRCPGTELFDLLELCLGDGLEKQEHMAVIFRRDCTVMIIVLKCLSLCVFWQSTCRIGGMIMICLEKWS